MAIGQVLLEILIEELHNHLYLKSFYCDVRWKSYTRGQANLPQVDFGDDAEPSSFAPSHLEPSFHTSGRSTARLPRLTKLQRYLNWLSLKPSINPLLDEPVDDVKESTTAAEDGMYESGGSFSAGSGSADLESVAAAAAAEATTQKARAKNPELDSFAYLEQLVESVAVLGKLGYGLDAVAQRVQGEMFSLVEATVEEVEERFVSSFSQSHEAITDTKLVNQKRYHPTLHSPFFPSLLRPSSFFLPHHLGDSPSQAFRYRDRGAGEQHRDPQRSVLDALLEAGCCVAGLPRGLRGRRAGC